MGSLPYPTWTCVQHCPGLWPWHKLQGTHHHKSSLPRRVQPPPASVSLLALTHFTGGGSPLGAGDTHPLHHHPVPTHCNTPPPRKGPLALGALGAIALARMRLAAQPWPRSSPWFNDGQTTPQEFHRRGALEKQAGPGTGPVRMGGSELGAHACDHTTVCEHACAHTWMCLHARAYPAVSHAHMYLQAYLIMHTCVHAWSCKHIHVLAHACTHTLVEARTYSHT